MAKKRFRLYKLVSGVPGPKETENIVQTPVKNDKGEIIPGLFNRSLPAAARRFKLPMALIWNGGFGGSLLGSVKQGSGKKQKDFD
jgi:hypothetical protein